MSSLPRALRARLRPELASLRAYRTKAAPAIKLDANESPWPPPKAVWEDALRALQETPIHRYPDGRATALREALAQHLGVPAEPLVLGTGSDEVIAILMNAFGVPGAKVAFPTPTFVMYDATARAHGLTPVAVPLDDALAFDEAAFSDALDRHRPALAFYATPNNPTGRPIATEVLRRVVEAFPDTLHIIDEAYAPFARQSGREALTLMPWAFEQPNVAVMGTLSKIGLAGLRVGYLAASDELAAELEKVRQPFNLNAPAQVLATTLLTRHQATLDAAIRRIVEERERVFAHLTQLNRAPIPSMANFILARVKSAEAATLRDGGIGIRVFSDPALAGWARITIGNRTENDALLTALR